MYQICNRKLKKYEEFLNLPLTAFVRHFLRFAVGHRHHNRQMLTGWMIGSPSSIADRNDTMNNVLIESSASNYAKWDFAEPTYDRIKALMKLIRVPTKFYNPDALNGVKATGIDLEEDEEMYVCVDDETYGGPAIDDAMVKEYEVADTK